VPTRQHFMDETLTCDLHPVVINVLCMSHTRVVGVPTVCECHAAAGEDFNRMLYNPYFDFLTLHVYPYNWQVRHSRQADHCEM
jgi:hypothetical protein